MFDEHVRALTEAIRTEERAKLFKWIDAADMAVQGLRAAVGADNSYPSGTPSVKVPKAPKARAASAPKGRAVFVTVGEAREAAPRVLTAMVGRGDMRCKDISTLISVPVPVVSKAIRLLKEAGDVGWVSGQTGAALYRLTEKGHVLEQLSNGSDAETTAAVNEGSEIPQQEG